MSKGFLSPLQKRLHKKLDEAGFATLSQRDVQAIQRAFVAALREEVETRYEASKSAIVKLNPQPLVIAGLGSFKMRTRPAKNFCAFRYVGNRSAFGNDGPRETVATPPARRLVFSSKWEEIK